MCEIALSSVNGKMKESFLSWYYPGQPDNGEAGRSKTGPDAAGAACILSAYGTPFSHTFIVVMCEGGKGI